MIDQVNRQIRRALSSVRQAFRGKGSAVNSAGPVQLVDAEGLAGEQIRAAEMLQHYGLTSVPPAGFMFVALPLGGKTSHGVVVATEHASYRLKGLKSGEVAVYSDEGDSVVLKRGRLVEVTTQTLRVNASQLIELNAPTVTVNAGTQMQAVTPKVQLTTSLVNATGALTAAGDITDMAGAGGKSMAAMRSTYNSHTHHENNTSGDTNVPTQGI